MRIYYSQSKAALVNTEAALIFKAALHFNITLLPCKLNCVVLLRKHNFHYSEQTAATQKFLTNSFKTSKIWYITNNRVSMLTNEHTRYTCNIMIWTDSHHHQNKKPQSSLDSLGLGKSTCNDFNNSVCGDFNPKTPVDSDFNLNYSTYSAGHSRSSDRDSTLPSNRGASEKIENTRNSWMSGFLRRFSKAWSEEPGLKKGGRVVSYFGKCTPLVTKPAPSFMKDLD